MNATDYRYYISTGNLSVFFTLRVRYDEVVYTGSKDSYVANRDYHVQNLAMTEPEAIAKALEITGLTLPIGFTKEGQRKTSESIDWSILRGGKFEGQSIYSISQTEDGKKYLVWLCENVGEKSSTYGKTVVLAKALLTAELETREQDRRTQAIEREAITKSRITQILALGVVPILRSSGDWASCVADGLLNGETVSPRCAEIVVDIMAKFQGGRKGSKKFETRRGELEDMGVYDLLTGAKN